MRLNRRSVLMGTTVVATLGLWRAFGAPLFGPAPAEAAAGSFPVTLPDAEWEKRLDPKAFDVLRRSGTEWPFTSPLNREHRPGTFACAGCSSSLFSSRTKFESHTGWPSFWAPLPGSVAGTRDVGLGMARTEIHCATCGGHLGHVFRDGPQPTGLRYCMNGVAMRFAPEAT